MAHARVTPIHLIISFLFRSQEPRLCDGGGGILPSFVIGGEPTAGGGVVTRMMP